MKILTLAAVAAGLTVAGSASAAVNLLSNGSFENGLAGWTHTASGPDAAPGAHPAVVIGYGTTASYPVGAFGELILPDNAASGSTDAVGVNALYFVADDADESISQSVMLAAGDYTIGFDVYVPFNGKANAGDATFIGDVAGVQLANFSAHATAAGQWFNFQQHVHINTTQQYVTTFKYHSVGTPAADFLVDRAFIVAGNGIPEPASWALMILGFGGVGATLRNRRRAVAA